MSSRIKRQAPRPRGFHAIQIHHAGTIQRGEIACLTDLLYQRGENLVAKSSQSVVVQGIECKPTERWAHHIESLINIPSKVSTREELRTQSMGRRLRQAQLCDKIRQGHRTAGPRYSMQQPQRSVGHGTAKRRCARYGSVSRGRVLGGRRNPPIQFLRFRVPTDSLSFHGLVLVN